MANVCAGGDATREKTVTATASTASVEDSHSYFDSYADLKVHEVMLRDWPRNSAYRRFFEENLHLVQDKVVMDVGAGTGILSLFAASVGARKVYAIEASNTAVLCKEIVECNGLSDRIEVIHSTVEDVDLGPGVKVDLIVSEWMGFYLLHESMLDSVLAARDKFLADDGIMVPSAARMCLAPVNLESFLEEKFEFWNNVCGFDFSPAIPHVHRKLLQEPLTTELEVKQVVGAPQVLREFDLKTVSLAEIQALSDSLFFHVREPATVHGFAIWFDVDFRQGRRQGHQLFASSSSDSDVSSSPGATGATATGADSHEGDWKFISPLVLSTSPARPPTHWKQTVVLLPRALAVDPSDSLGCKVTLTQSPENHRHYNIELELLDENDDGGDESDEGSGDEDDDHPVPCECGRPKCQLIKALMDKYGEEQDAIEAEAELVDLTAQVEAAEAIGVEMDDDDDMIVSEGKDQ